MKPIETQALLEHTRELDNNILRQSIQCIISINVQTAHLVVIITSLIYRITETSKLSAMNVDDEVPARQWC